MMPTKLKRWLDLSLITAVALLLLFFTLRASRQLTGGEISAPLDDTWIHFQFARNLSQGHGFSYNPDEPTPGSTAPLWTLLLAGVGLFTTDFMLPSLALSAFFLLMAAWLAYGLTQNLTGARWAGLLAGLGVAATGRLLWAGLAGMETTAFAALSLAAVWAYVRWGLRPFPVLLFALAAQLRPEGHALFALAALDTAVTHLAARKAWRELLRQTAVAGLLYGVVAAPYVLFSLATTGRPLPNTFYAKASASTLFSWRTLRETAVYHWQDNPVSVALLSLGLIPLWRRGRLVLLWLAGLPLFTAVIIDFTWHHGRYTMPLIPFQMVAAGVGAHWLAQRRRAAQRGTARGRSWALPLALGALLLLGGLWGVPRWAAMHGHNAREILDIDVALGKWLAVNTPPDALLAVDDIGAITFLAQRRIVDMNGLVSPEVWTAVREPDRETRSRELTRILSQAQPDLMVAFPLWRWEIATNPLVAVERYHVATSTHTIIFQQDAYVYEMTWPYVAQADPQRRLDVMLGDGLRLLGVDTAVTPDALSLTLFWQSVAPVAANYDVFIHVLNEAGQIVAQADRQPVGGLAATSVWQPGDMVRDPLTITLPPDLAAGTYTVQAGMYLRETGVRLPVTGDNPNGDAVLLTSFMRR